MWIRYLMLAFLGLASGLVVSGAVFSLVVKIGVIPRLAAFTRTAKNVFYFEDSILFGGVIGCLATLFPVPMPFGNAGLLIYGLFAGIYLGCLIVALAEVLNVIPIVLRRINLKKGVGFVILSMALGKMAGSLLYFYKDWKK